MKSARVQLRRKVAKRLRRVAGSVEKEDRRTPRSLERESLSANDDAVRPETAMAQCERMHRAEVSRAPRRTSEPCEG